MLTFIYGVIGTATERTRAEKTDVFACFRTSPLLATFRLTGLADSESFSGDLGRIRV